MQHLLARASDRVLELIEAGGIVCVCGDGARMEPDVKRTLIQPRATRAGVGEADVRRWLEELGAEARYVLDVWAGS